MRLATNFARFNLAKLLKENEVDSRIFYKNL